MNIDEMPPQPFMSSVPRIYQTNSCLTFPPPRKPLVTEKKKRQLLGREILDHKKNSGGEPDTAQITYLYLYIQLQVTNESGN